MSRSFCFRWKKYATTSSIGWSAWIWTRFHCMSFFMGFQGFIIFLLFPSMVFLLRNERWITLVSRIFLPQYRIENHRELLTTLWWDTPCFQHWLEDCPICVQQRDLGSSILAAATLVTGMHCDAVLSIAIVQVMCNRPCFPYAIMKNGFQALLPRLAILCLLYYACYWLIYCFTKNKNWEK